MSLSWTKTPLRFLQHLLRETDAQTVSVEQLIAEMKQVGANAAISMGGGFSAWYPTELASQTINPHMAGDFLAAFLEAAKNEAFRVLIRMDISKGRQGQELIEPDWFVRKPDGSVATVWAMPQMCPTGAFWQSEVPAILDEIMTRYPQGDGFFFNYLYVARCYCARCQEAVSGATGEAIPAEGETSVAYERWRQDFLVDYVGRLRAFVHARNPAAALVPYHHVHDGWDVPRMAAVSDIIGSQVSNPVMPNPIDPQPMWALWAAEEAKLAHALKPQAAPLLIQTTSAVFASRQSAMPGARLIHNMIQAGAHGASTVPAVNGTLDLGDTRFVPALENIGRYFARNAASYSGLRSLARVAVLRSEATRFWGAGEKADNEARVGEYRGVCEMLSDLHYPFDLVVSGALTPEGLARYQIVVLPDVLCLSIEDAEALDAFCAQGGALIVTGAAPQCDGFGAIVDGGLLAALPVRPLPARSVNGAYLVVGEADLLNAVEGVRYIPVDGAFYPNATGSELEADLRLLGPFVNNAPEFTTVEGDGDAPGLLRFARGAGQTHWLPWQIGGLYNGFGLADYRALFGALVARVIGSAPLKFDVSVTVETTLYDHASGLVLHLINRAAVSGKPLLDASSLAAFSVEVTGEFVSAWSLTREAPVALTLTATGVSLTLDRLNHFEAIVLSRAGDALSVKAPNYPSALHGIQERETHVCSL